MSVAFGREMDCAAWAFSFCAKRLSENVAAGILACRRGRHLAARKYRLHGGTLRSYRGSSGGDAAPPGWKPRLYVSQDGRRYDFQTGSMTATMFLSSAQL